MASDPASPPPRFAPRDLRRRVVLFLVVVMAVLMARPVARGLMHIDPLRAKAIAAWQHRHPGWRVERDLDHPWTQGLHLTWAPGDGGARALEWSALASFPVPIAVVSAPVGEAGDFDDADLRRLARLPTLDALDIRGPTAVTDAGVAYFAGRVRLSALHLGASPGVTDAGVAAIAAWGDRLTFFRMTDAAGVTDAALASLARCERLDSLHLHGAVQVTSRGVEALAPLAGRLRELDLRDSPIDDLALHALTGQTALHVLQVNASRVTDAGVASLATLPDLATLVLFDAVAITDRAMTALAEAPHLHQLTVNGASRVTDAGVAPYAPHWVDKSPEAPVFVLYLPDSPLLTKTEWRLPYPPASGGGYRIVDVSARVDSQVVFRRR